MFHFKKTLDKEEIMFELASFLSFSVYENVPTPLRATQLRFIRVLHELSLKSVLHIRERASFNFSVLKMNIIYVECF